MGTLETPNGLTLSITLFVLHVVKQGPYFTYKTELIFTLRKLFFGEDVFREGHSLEKISKVLQKKIVKVVLETVFIFSLERGTLKDSSLLEEVERRLYTSLSRIERISSKLGIRDYL